MIRYITCPWCHNQMEIDDCEGGSIERCSHCRGAWLNNQQLERLLQTSVVESNGAEDDRSASRREPSSSTSDEFDWF